MASAFQSLRASPEFPPGDEETDEERRAREDAAEPTKLDDQAGTAALQRQGVARAQPAGVLDRVLTALRGLGSTSTAAASPVDATPPAPSAAAPAKPGGPTAFSRWADKIEDGDPTAFGTKLKPRKKVDVAPADPRPEANNKFEPLATFAPSIQAGDAVAIGEREGDPQPGQVSPSTDDDPTSHTNLPPNVAEFMRNRASAASGVPTEMNPAQKTMLLRSLAPHTLGWVNPYSQKEHIIPGALESDKAAELNAEEPAKQMMRDRAMMQQQLNNEKTFGLLRHQQNQDEINSERTGGYLQRITDQAKRDADRSQAQKDALAEKQKMDQARIDQIKAKVTGSSTLTPKDLPKDLSDRLDDIASIHRIMDEYGKLPGVGPIGGRAPEQSLDALKSLGDPLGVLGKKSDGSMGEPDDAREMRLRLGQLAINKESSLSSSIFRNPNNMKMMRQAYGLLQTGSDAQIRKGVQMMEQAINSEIGQRKAMAPPGKAAAIDKAMESMRGGAAPAAPAGEAPPIDTSTPVREPSRLKVLGPNGEKGMMDADEFEQEASRKGWRLANQ